MSKQPTTEDNAPPDDGRGHSKALWWVATVLMGVGLATAIVFASRFGDDPNFVESPLIGQPMPAVTLDALDGSGPIDFREYVGEITVVNFWASYCFPCRNEHGLLTEAARQFEGVNFIGVATLGDTADRANEFLDELGRSYPSVLDPDARGAVSFGVFGIPETYFVDAEGIVVAKITGELRPGVLDDTLNRILLGERPGSRTLGTVTQ
jgi:cytochrome c biogenesis protein CcmG/thiol:disulfide interchange protein DsbE